MVTILLPPSSPLCSSSSADRRMRHHCTGKSKMSVVIYEFVCPGVCIVCVICMVCVLCIVCVHVCCVCMCTLCACVCVQCSVLCV